MLHTIDAFPLQSSCPVWYHGFMGRAALLESLHFSAGDILLNVVQWFFEWFWLWWYSEYIPLLDIAAFIRKVQFLFHLIFHLNLSQGSASLFIFLPKFSFFYLVLLSTFCLNCWGFCQLICGLHMLSVSLDSVACSICQWVYFWFFILYLLLCDCVFAWQAEKHLEKSEERF